MVAMVVMVLRSVDEVFGFTRCLKAGGQMFKHIGQRDAARLTVGAICPEPDGIRAQQNRAIGAV